MLRATRPVKKEIAIAFDFDDTLVPDAYNALLADLGLDVRDFRQKNYEVRKASGWDPIPAKFYSVIEESRRRSSIDDKITKELLQEFGRRLKPFDGVAEMFDRLSQHASTLDPEVELEFYLITSGFGEVARNASIAPFFKAMWGGEFHYLDSGEVECIKRSISFTEKVQYLYAISKGVDDNGDCELGFAYEDVPQDNVAIPLTQIIYVGDGKSDVPCFSMLNKEGGIGIALYKDKTPQEWADNLQLSKTQRVSNLIPTDYREGSELMTALRLAIESICKEIQLKTVGSRV